MLTCGTPDAPTANCNLDGSHYSEPSNQGNVTLKFEQPGTRYFKCSGGWTGVDIEMPYVLSYCCA